MANISGKTTGIDTKDNVRRELKEGNYSYTLRVSGGGHVRFKVEAYSHLAWRTIEERSKVATGAVLKGIFCVPESGLEPPQTRAVRFIFSRGILTEGSKYDLTYEPA